MKTYTMTEAKMQAVIEKLTRAQMYKMPAEEPRPVTEMDIACSRIEDALSMLRSISPRDYGASVTHNLAEALKEIKEVAYGAGLGPDGDALKTYQRQALLDKHSKIVRIANKALSAGLLRVDAHAKQKGQS